MKVSVCIATYNGERFILEQLNSILKQLDQNDEIIVSDDCSSDKTIELIKSIRDSRIKLYSGKKYSSLIYNFENAIKQASGDIIFLSDQDDVWLENKVSLMTEKLKDCDLVVSDAIVVDKDLNVIRPSFWNQKNPIKSFWYNLYKNPYLGCCMAFKKEVLQYVLPFPHSIAMHDIWIGLCCQLHGKCEYINVPLIKYRRHGANASCTSETSRNSLFYKIKYRFIFLYYLFLHK